MLQHFYWAFLAALLIPCIIYIILVLLGNTKNRWYLGCTALALAPLLIVCFRTIYWESIIKVALITAILIGSIDFHWGVKD